MSYVMEVRVCVCVSMYVRNIVLHDDGLPNVTCYWYF